MKYIFLAVLLIFISCESQKEINIGIKNKYLKVCILRNCELNRIDPIIVSGLIYAESKLKKYSKSPSGALHCT